MSSAVSGSVYVFDTSALMDWHDRYYPPDVFPMLVTMFDNIIEQERFLSVEIAYDEIFRVGTAGLQTWAKARKSSFDSTKNHLAEALAIEGAYPALLDTSAQFDEADAYVIGLAQRLGAVVVTAETPAAHKRKPRRSLYIPDVCAALGMTCIANLGMMRREGWRL